MYKRQGIQVDIAEGQEYGIQKISIEAENGSCMVDTLNRGGGRLVLRNASPSLEEARAAAERLGIVLVEAGPAH